LAHVHARGIGRGDGAADLDFEDQCGTAVRRRTSGWAMWAVVGRGRTDEVLVMQGRVGVARVRGPAATRPGEGGSQGAHAGRDGRRCVGPPLTASSSHPSQARRVSSAGGRLRRGDYLLSCLGTKKV